MPNRRLTADELEVASALLETIRSELADRSNGDAGLLFALRRKIFKELMYDERSRPMDRRKLKLSVRKQQDGLCAICQNALPDSYTVLDRYEAAKGYVEGNVRVLCEPCDRQVQMERRYT